MDIQIIDINEIKPNPNNPRVIKDEKYHQLVKSIKEFPKMLEIRPIVVNEDMIVLGGNMRLKACKQAGLKELPIIKASTLTEEEQREFIIKDNVGYGEWDWQQLTNDWDTEQLQDWGLDLPDFTIAEEKDPNDISDTIKQEYRIEIILPTEELQELTYNKLIEEGYECRILTL
jgi:ParB-like chromosome segregation protein Spo0J